MKRFRILGALALAAALTAGCQPKSTVQQPTLGQAPATVASTVVSVDITIPPAVTSAPGTVPVTQPRVVVTPPTVPPATAAPSAGGLSNDNTYVNSAGQTIHSPAYSSGGVPAGATARCNDGTYSFSATHSGTCSHHGGVAQWLTP